MLTQPALGEWNFSADLVPIGHCICPVHHHLPMRHDLLLHTCFHSPLIRKATQNIDGSSRSLSPATWSMGWNHSTQWAGSKWEPFKMFLVFWKQISIKLKVRCWNTAFSLVLFNDIWSLLGWHFFKKRTETPALPGRTGARMNPDLYKGEWGPPGRLEPPLRFLLRMLQDHGPGYLNCAQWPSPSHKGPHGIL